MEDLQQKQSQKAAPPETGTKRKKNPRVGLTKTFIIRIWSLMSAATESMSFWCRRTFERTVQMQGWGGQAMAQVSTLPTRTTNFSELLFSPFFRLFSSFTVAHLKQHKSMGQSSSGQARSLQDSGRHACGFNEVRKRETGERWKVGKSKRIPETFCAGEGTFFF